MRPIRVLTWHVHGNYLLYLSQARVEFYLPVAPGRPGHGGRGTSFPFPDRVREVAVEQLSELEFDCILFQSRRTTWSTNTRSSLPRNDLFPAFIWSTIRPRNTQPTLGIPWTTPTPCWCTSPRSTP